LQEIDPRAKFVLLIWNFLSNLSGPANEAENTQTARRFLDEEPTSQLVTETLKGLGFGDYEAYKACQAIKWMLINTNWLTEKDLTPSELLEQWLQDEQFKEYLELNEYNQVFWFNKEKFESMLWYMHIATILRYASDPSISSVEQVEAILRAEPIFAALQKLLRNPNSGSINSKQRWIKPLSQPERASSSERRRYRPSGLSFRFARVGANR